MYSTMLSRPASTARTALRLAARAATVACVLSFGSACSLLSGQLERAAKGAGKVVTYYCENVTVPEIREEVRAAVNKHAAPHSVAVTCVDGGPTMNSTEATAPVSENSAGPTEPVPTASILDWLVRWLDPDRKPIVIIEPA